MRAAALLLAMAAGAASGATKIVVTVVEAKSGRPVTGLKAGDFTVLDDKAQRQVEAAELVRSNLDIVLLLDTSLAGGAVQPIAENLVAQLEPKEQMSVVAFHSSADLIQDFTSSKQLILRSLAGVKYGNSPRVLDAIYAAIDGGFQNTVFRRAILLLTTGVDAGSRTSEREVIRTARRNGVSIFPVYMMGSERWLFENLARQTGGASFNLRDMQRSGEAAPGPRIFEVMRAHYDVTVRGNLSLGEKVKVEVRRADKVFVSALPE